MCGHRYQALRRQKNLVLVAGSGFGDAEGSLPYLTGAWSLKFGRPAMPFDGILLGSRMMVATEARTAPAVKKLIVETPGIENELEWESSYNGVAGGVITVTSELGEPIHKLATRGMLLWREFDQLFFSLPRGPQRAQTIALRKAYIIKRLNADYQKVYFGKNATGAVVDLPEMTYFEVLARMVELMFIDETKEAAYKASLPNEFRDSYPIVNTTGRWIDLTYRSRVFSMLERTEARFLPLSGTDIQPAARVVMSEEQLNSNPAKLVADVAKAYPQSHSVVLSELDVDFFYHLCRFGGKPVNFVPVVDADLSYWFKIDSLWYSEDLAAVPDHDAQRVCVLQGPVSVRHSTSMSESSTTILAQICDGWSNALLKDLCATSDNLSEIEFLVGTADDAAIEGPDFTQEGWSVTKDSNTITITLPNGPVSVDSAVWLRYLGGTAAGWRSALFLSDHVVRGKRWVANPVRKIFRPRSRQTVRVTTGKTPDKDMIQVFRDSDMKVPVLEARFMSEKQTCRGEGRIVVSVRDFGVQQADSSTFLLEYAYHPRTSCSPLHEVADDVSQKSQAFYGALWGIKEAMSESMKASKISDKLRLTPRSPRLPAELLTPLQSSVQITADMIRDFNSAAFGIKTDIPTIDFAIVAGWKTVVSSLFFDSLNGNLFELVHLSNEFTLVSEKSKVENVLAPGLISSVGEVTSIENGPTGKTVTVQVVVSRPDDPSVGAVIVISKFFYRGAYTDHNCTFKRSQTDLWVTLASNEDIAIFKSKKWIRLDSHVANQISVGQKFRFRISSLEEGLSAPRLAAVSVFGDVLMTTDADSEDVRVGSIQLEVDDVNNNEVEDYLKKHGDKNGISFFESSGYRMLSKPSRSRSPLTNMPYAVASTDLNPIHRNEYMADLASLPGTITHGMWSSANAGRIVRDTVGAHVHSFRAQFKGMVLPDTELFTELKHVGMHDGMMVLEFKTANDQGDIVLDGRAVVPQGTTTYVFTGQGSAEVGMGMNLFTSSSAARIVWERADSHLRKTFSFSILEIVQKNPKSWTVNFGGRRGRQVLRNYLALETASRDGKTMVPLLPDISESSRKYTFRASDGLLFATQFTQIALVLQEKAAFDDMKAHGLVSDDSFFAGHSLGEYAAVTSTCNLFSIEALVEIVFMRGLVMQTAVPRDEHGRSSFGMVAASPMRVGPHLTLSKLTELVDEIDRSNELLQVVNFNVEGVQYVVAGELSSLEILSRTLDAVTSKPDLVNDVISLVTTVKEEVVQKFAAIRQRGDPIKLERGKATIPLPGIDVPFHSRYLSSGVPAFRDVLLQKMDVNRIRHILHRLEGRYIPNVIAEPFSVSRNFVDMLYKCTQSTFLVPLTESTTFDAAVKEDKAAVARTILIELLAYQFASPVRWVETQAYLFTHGVDRFIEIGPGATLSNMAARTLQFADISPRPEVDIYFFGKDQGRLYYSDNEDQGLDLESYIESVAAASGEPDLPMAEVDAPASSTTDSRPPPAPAPDAPVSRPQTSDSPPEDKPISALDTLKTLLALKLKRGFEDISDTTTIQSLVGGKSALQNELIGDIDAEFGETPDGSADLPLAELGKTIGIGYTDLGKTTATLIQKRIGGVLSAGFGMSRVKSYLAEERMLGPNMINAVLLSALLQQPPARFASDSETTAFLDSVADGLGKRLGIVIPKASQTSTMSIAPAFNFPMPQSSGVPATVDDEPVHPLVAMKVLLALKLKKTLSDIKDSSTVTELVGGKSAIQNELIGDFEQEFGDMPDGSAEVPIAELAAMFSSYAVLGKTTSGQVQKLVSSKMPGGFGMADIKKHLMDKFGLQGQRVFGVLLVGLLSAPQNRLGSESETHSWLDSAVTAYASVVGLDLAKGGTSGGERGSVGVPMQMMQGTPEALKTHQKLMKRMIKSQIATLNEFLGEDPMEAERRVEDVERILRESEVTAAALDKEHGDVYRDGIQGIFNPTMVRRYDSSWNWARQEAIEVYHILTRRKDEFHSPSMESKRRHLLNRSSASLLDLISRLAQRTGEENNWRVSKWFQNLATDMKEKIDTSPHFVGALPHLQPCVSLDAGKLQYTEEPRSGITDSKDYVAEMAGNESRAPYLSLRPSNVHAEGALSKSDATQRYFGAMNKVCSDGVSFASRNALVTGCGPGSIGIEVVRMLLQGGARVIATTSGYSSSKIGMFRRVYEECGSRGSELIVLPFNQASSADVSALIDYVYDTLNRELDIVVPFAAISENGRDISAIDDRSELSHRIMTTNLIRMLGAIKSRKEERGEVTRPAAVVLPLSPNHGVFGFDGLYAESKLGLEALFNKWSSESWEDYLVLAGSVIGWTRGTGLMAGNNIAARGVEEKGCRTFSTTEMALNIVTLFHDSVLDILYETPLWADFGGGFEAIDNLNEVTATIRKTMLLEASCEKAVLQDNRVSPTMDKPHRGFTAMASNTFEGTTFPDLPNTKFRDNASAVRGLINLEKTVVVVGFGEVGPWGSSRTRWEMEAYGTFSMEGCIEMAWLMGMISYFNGKLADGKQYIGWVDRASKVPIAEHKIKEMYESRIIEHAGVRLINPEPLEGYDPKEKLFLQQVAIAHDMDWIEVADRAEAVEFRTQLGTSNVDIRPADGGAWQMKLKKGAVLHIPKAKAFDRLVAGQVPDGWDALRYGVPQDIVQQVDPVTLHTIVATGEALIAAGITDPYEFYHYVHVSDVGNSSGGGMGGMRAIRRIFGERMLQKSMQSDILQESFINTMTAWVNMLLLSSSGPIKTPVGACATAAESVDIAVETILSGKAKVMVAGGYDGFSEESSYEFAQMKATSNTDTELAMGRDPKDMCRPTSTTRGGFMESEGAGMQILMSADLAVKMGCPIFGIVAITNTATDKVGRSVPAPGQGILTTARESQSNFSVPLLDVQYRKKNYEHTLRYVNSWRKIETELIEAEAATILATSGEAAKSDFLAERTQFMERECTRLQSDAQVHWGMNFYHDSPDISPLRGALSVWGLDVDDITVATFHGTGTKLNDKNESDVTNSQLAHLGRTKGNPCMVVCQKWLTGHPKGAAAAWMLNGALQMMSRGVIPGNRNADNVDPALEKFENLLYPNRTMDVGRVNAVLLKSFGFGQAGGEVLMIHPDYLLAALDDDQFAQYCELRGCRERAAQRALHEAIADKKPVVRIKTQPPYTPEQEKHVYLDPLARVQLDEPTGVWAFSDEQLKMTSKHQTAPRADENAQDIRTETEAILASLRAGPRVTASDADYRNDVPFSLPDDSKPPSPQPSGTATPRKLAQQMELAMRETAGGMIGGERGVGIDVEPIKTFEGASKTFINRNFTEAEKAYCLSAPNPAASFAGRWAAKEAVIKAISSSALDSRNLWRDSAAPLKDIHVRRGESGAPFIELDGHARKVAQALGVTKVQVSISYFADNAVAQAVALS